VLKDSILNKQSQSLTQIGKLCNRTNLCYYNRRILGFSPHSVLTHETWFLIGTSAPFCSMINLTGNAIHSLFTKREWNVTRDIDDSRSHACTRESYRSENQPRQKRIADKLQWSLSHYPADQSRSARRRISNYSLKIPAYPQYPFLFADSQIH